MTGKRQHAVSDEQAADRADHRHKPRRRGEVLFRAIFEAAVAELTEVGYAGFTMERVAERAHTSKASLYLRWPGRAELIADAAHRTISDAILLPETGELRAEILAVLRRISAVLAGPMGEAVRGLMADTLRDPEIARSIRTRLTESGHHVMLEVLRRGAVRGDVRLQALTLRVATVGPALLRYHFLVHGAPIPDEVLTGIVDDVILPLIRTSD